MDPRNQPVVGAGRRSRHLASPVTSRGERGRALSPFPAVAMAFLLVAGCGLARGEERAEVVAGSSMTLKLEQTLHSERHGSGDPFTATVAEPLTAEGRVLVPRGATVHGGVVELSEDPPRVQLAFHALEVRGERHELEAELVHITPRKHSEMTDEAAKIGGGAAAGAVLGGVIGGNVKGAVIGAAAGAAAGTGLALATKDTHVYLPAGSLLKLRLDRALQVRLEEPEVPPDREAGGS